MHIKTNRRRNIIIPVRCETRRIPLPGNKRPDVNESGYLICIRIYIYLIYVVWGSWCFRGALLAHISTGVPFRKLGVSPRRRRRRRPHSTRLLCGSFDLCVISRTPRIKHTTHTHTLTHSYTQCLDNTRPGLK